MGKSGIMAAILATTCANLMGVRASRSIGIVRRCNNFSNPRDAQSISNLSIRSMTNSAAFMNSPSTFVQRRREQQLTVITALQPTLLSSFNRCCNIHSTTMLMGSRKKGGGRSKKGKPRSNKRSKREAEDDDLPLQTTLTADEDTEDEESGPEFDPSFASEYHAPVMPVECIDALLQQGEWAEMMLARKEKWRKKRSIIEAKKKRDGFYDGLEEDVESEVTDANEEGAQLSSTSEVSTSNERKQQPRLFIDGTLGGGGHSQALLQQLSAGDILIGCDVDPEALSTASDRLVEYLGTSDYILDSQGKPECEWEKERPMFIPVQSNFRNLVTVLSKVRHPITGKLLLGDRDGTADENEEGDLFEFPCGVNGMLLDLGVSSHQIDEAERGFAFMKEGPLDMRMSGNSQSLTLTAADICNEFDEATIIDLLRTYGDEPRAKRVANAIVNSRPLVTTTDLVHAINTVTPTFARQKRAGLIATSARVFQALRIVVNEEDGALKEVLERVAPWALARSGSHHSKQMVSDGETIDGILAVLSYHSMEDKMAKRVIRDGDAGSLSDKKSRRRGGGALERDIYGNVIEDGTKSIPFEPLTKQRKATDEEVAVNSRSRSATLRVAIRV